MQTLDVEVVKGQLVSWQLEQLEAPIKVLQFGEGNFLRAFADRFFDMAAEHAGWRGRIAMFQPLGSSRQKSSSFAEQDGLYTVLVRGLENGQIVDDRRIITCVAELQSPYEDDGFDRMLEVARLPELEYVASNTTEVGIAYDGSCAFADRPPASFPAKLTRVLYERFAAGLPGVVVLSCELIENNGAVLQGIVLRHAVEWELGAAFAMWLERECVFCTTLVDSIVPGRPQDMEEVERELGYHDAFLVMREPFQMWGIEGDVELAKRLPFVGVPEIEGAFVVPSITAYKTRKVRILNGCHTAFVPAALLAGERVVRDALEVQEIKDFVDGLLYEEILPSLEDVLPEHELVEFARAVLERFANPYIDHQMASICLNTTMKWRERVLPSIRAAKKPTPRLVASLAALIGLFTTDRVASDEANTVAIVPEHGAAFTFREDPRVIAYFDALVGSDDRTLVEKLLSDAELWGCDLSDLVDEVYKDLTILRQQGIGALLCREG